MGQRLGQCRTRVVLRSQVVAAVRRALAGFAGRRFHVEVGGEAAADDGELRALGGIPRIGAAEARADSDRGGVAERADVELGLTGTVDAEGRERTSGPVAGGVRRRCTLGRRGVAGRVVVATRVVRRLLRRVVHAAGCAAAVVVAVGHRARRGVRTVPRVGVPVVVVGVGVGPAITRVAVIARTTVVAEGSSAVVSTIALGAAVGRDAEVRQALQAIEALIIEAGSGLDTGQSGVGDTAGARREQEDESKGGTG